MANSGGDRSVKARDIIGSAVVTGPNNRVEMRGVKVTLPPAESVRPERELAELRALLIAMQVPERGRLDRALQDAEEEAAKPAPDKEEVGGALERVVKCAKGAAEFSEQVEKLAPKLAALAAWLGPVGHKLLVAAGLTG
jgi:hypothetical protein